MYDADWTFQGRDLVVDDLSSALIGKHRVVSGI